MQHAYPELQMYSYHAVELEPCAVSKVDTVGMIDALLGAEVEDARLLDVPEMFYLQSGMTDALIQVG